MENDNLLMIQFLEWIDTKPRTRLDVLDAWKSSCPRTSVWEDAQAEKYLIILNGIVTLNDLGRSVLTGSNNKL